LTLFDTPDSIGKKYDYNYNTLLKNYFKYYANRCDIIPQEFLEQLLSFFKTYVINYFTYGVEDRMKDNFMIRMHEMDRSNDINMACKLIISTETKK